MCNISILKHVYKSQSSNLQFSYIMNVCLVIASIDLLFLEFKKALTLVCSIRMVLEYYISLGGKCAFNFFDFWSHEMILKLSKIAS